MFRKGEDFKLLHIIEKFSTLSDHNMTSLGYSRLLIAILQFSRTHEYSRLLIDKSDADRIGDKEFTFGHIQYKLFVCTVQLLNCLKTLMDERVVHSAIRVNALMLFSLLI